MNRLKFLLFALALGVAPARLLLAQDAAAPIHRTSPTPFGAAPTPIGRGEDEATPEPTETPAATSRKASEPPRSSNGMALPTPEPTPPEPTPAVSQTPRTVEPTPIVQETPLQEKRTPAPREETPVPSTPEPTRQPTPEPTPKPTPAPTPKPTPKPTPTATPIPALTPEPTTAPTPESTPEATPESTPVRVEKTPPPTPTPAVTVPTPAPVEKEETATPKPTATPSSTPKRSILNEKPVRAVESRSPESRRPWDDDPIGRSSASRPTFDLSTRGDREIGEAVKRMENRWQAAIRNHDARALSALLAGDFVGKSATGRTGSKADVLAALKKDENVYITMELLNLSVTTEGNDTAIVTGVTKESGTTKVGKRFKTSRRFTDKWVKRNGKWRCISSETTDA